MVGEPHPLNLSSPGTWSPLEAPRRGVPAEADAFDALDADGTWTEIVAWFERQREWGEIEAQLDQAAG